jgi:hypothetical protein
MIKHILLSLCICAFATTTHASTITHVTQYGTSAKTKALGSIEGLGTHATSLQENPASIQYLERLHHISTFYTTLSDQETTYANMAYVTKIGKSRIGFGLSRLAIPNLEHTGLDENDEITVEDHFNAEDRLYTLGVSYPLNNYINIGLSGHLYEQQLYNVKGSGSNANIGATFTYKSLQSSVVAKNILKSMKVNYNQGLDNLKFPFKVLASTKYGATSYMNLYAQLKYSEAGNHFLKSVAAEFQPSIYAKGLKVYIGWKEDESATLLKNRIALGVGLELHHSDIQFVYEHTENSFNTALYGLSVNINI